MIKYKNKKILIFDNNYQIIEIISNKNISINSNYFENISDAFNSYRDNKYNLLIINISNNKSIDFIKRIKQITKNKPIIVIADKNIDSLKINELMSYHVDGLLIDPFKKEDFETLIANIFERQEEQDQLFTYLKELETNSFNEVKTTHKKCLKINPTTHNVFVENYETEEIISAKEFFDIFDDSIADKIDDLRGYINDFSAELFSMEDNNDITILIESFNKLSLIMKNISSTLFYFQYFKIAVKAFLELSELLNNVKISEDIFNNRNLIIDFLLHLDKDFETWFNELFITRAANNIFYFDSSLLSNVYMLSALIKNEEINSSEIEFF